MWKLAIVGPLMALVCLFSSPANGQKADDKINGALWHYSMTPKKSGPKPLTGQFRVDDDVLYQKSKPKSKSFDKVVGKNSPNGRTTRIEFTGVRGIDSDKTSHPNLKGSVLLKAERYGEWSGTFIDAEGRHWDFKCSRVQE